MRAAHSGIISSLLGLLLLAVAVIAKAEEAATSACGPADVHLAEEASWPPFTLEEQGVASKGLSYELMQLIFGHMGRCADIRLVPQARMLQMARQGKVDGVTVISLSPERAKFLAYTSPPLLTRRAYIYYRKDRPTPIEMESWENLRGLQVATVRGRNYPESFNAAVAQGVFSTIEVVSASQMFELLVKGRVDAFPSMDLEAAEFITSPAYRGQIVASMQPYMEYHYYLAISRQSPLVQSLPEINQAITELQFNGELPALLKRYGL